MLTERDEHRKEDIPQRPKEFLRLDFSRGQFQILATDVAKFPEGWCPASVTIRVCEISTGSFQEESFDENALISRQLGQRTFGFDSESFENDLVDAGAHDGAMCIFRRFEEGFRLLLSEVLLQFAEGSLNQLRSSFATFTEIVQECSCEDFTEGGTSGGRACAHDFVFFYFVFGGTCTYTLHQFRY